jgi:undecaprenyl-diphosphatase
LLLSVSGGLLLNNILKLAFHRARPQFDDPLLMLTTYSFPSGHTMNATVLYGALATFVFAKSKSWPPRIVAAAVAITFIVLVAFSRVYLGAHYLSDVLGAICEGLAWTALCLTALYYFWKQAEA